MNVGHLNTLKVVYFVRWYTSQTVTNILTSVWNKPDRTRLTWQRGWKGKGSKRYWIKKQI